MNESGTTSTLFTTEGEYKERVSVNRASLLGNNNSKGKTKARSRLQDQSAVTSGSECKNQWKTF